MLLVTLSWHELRKRQETNVLHYFSTFPLSVTALIPVPLNIPAVPSQKSKGCKTDFSFLACSSLIWFTRMGLSRMQSARNYCAIPSMAVLPESKASCPAMPMDINKFSERLSHCMEQRGLNGVELSALSGVTTATISRYLNGLRMPTIDNIILLADALDVSVDYLLGLHDVPDDKILTAAYSIASSDDKRVIWTLLERYGGKPWNY